MISGKIDGREVKKKKKVDLLSSAEQTEAELSHWAEIITVRIRFSIAEPKKKKLPCSVQGLICS